MSYDKEQDLQQEIQRMISEEKSSKSSDTIKNVEIVENTLSPETLVEHQESPEIQDLSESEKQARALGWKSKEERLAEGKDNNHFVDADEYVRRQPLFERIDRQNKILNDLKEKQRLHDLHLQQVRKESYDQAMMEIKRQRDIEIDNANRDAVHRLDARQAQIQQQMYNDPIMQTRTQPDVIQEAPEVSEFKNQSWYKASTREDAEMVAVANATDTALANIARIRQGLAPNDPRTPNLNIKEHLAAVQAEVQRLFPHRFEKSRSDSSPIYAAAVGKSTSSVKDTKSSSNLVQRLTPQQKQLGEEFFKTNPDFTLEKYAKELDKMNRLGK